MWDATASRSSRRLVDRPRAVLIALLLVEQGAAGAAALDRDQMAYEQTSPTSPPTRCATPRRRSALEDALARVSRYAGATKAVLVQYPDGPTRPRYDDWSSTASESLGHRLA